MIVVIVVVEVVVVVVVVPFVVIVGTVAVATLISELFHYSRTRLHLPPVFIAFIFMSILQKSYWHDPWAQQLNDNIKYTKEWRGFKS